MVHDNKKWSFDLMHRNTEFWVSIHDKARSLGGRRFDSPHAPRTQPSLIRTRASYRKQSSCPMTSPLNPCVSWGVTSACGFARGFSTPKQIPRKAPCDDLSVFRSREQVGGAEPSPPSSTVTISSNIKPVNCESRSFIRYKLMNSFRHFLSFRVSSERN